MPRRLLYLDAAHLAAFAWQRGSLREEARFGPDQDGMAAFAAYLRRHERSVFLMLVDLAQEGYRIESLPRVRGADRAALLSRRLGHHFPDAPLAAAISLGREGSGRRDERVLFVAITRPQLVAPWLSVLRDAGTALAGVYSVPLLGPALLARLGMAPGPRLLVTAAATGVRQSFYEHGRLLFSRMTPLAIARPEEIAAACAAEADRTCRYLLAQRLVTPGMPLSTIVLAHPAHLALFQAACRDDERLHFHVADLHVLARACGLAPLPEDERSETLFLRLLHERRPRHQFAPLADRLPFRHRQIRLAVQGAGAAFLSACLLFAALQLSELSELRTRTAIVRAEADAAAGKYAAVRSAFPPLPLAPDRLRELIDRYDAMEGRSPPLDPLYLAVSRALQASPEVDIDRLEWRLRGDADQDAMSASAGPARTTHAMAVVYGTLRRSAASDQRGQLETVDRFVAALREDASLTVSVLSLPFDIDSGKPLKGGSNAGAGQGRFAVRLSRGL